MIQIPMHTTGTLERGSVSSLNTLKTSTIVTAGTILSINSRKSSASSGRGGSAGYPASSGHAVSTTAAASPASAASRTPTAAAAASSVSTSPRASASAAAASPVSTVPRLPLPAFRHPIAKGQKASLSDGKQLSSVRACFGWNVLNSDCDVDVSAFLLNQSGKVIGDSWFVFYGQTASPDKSIRFFDNAPNDREMITIDFSTLNPMVSKIAFVLTINDAFEKKLHFGMIKDAYIRIMNASGQSELVSFRMEESFTNVISIMIGEIYQYNGTWKFNAAGNGLARDLAGLCEFYGVQVV